MTGFAPQPFGPGPRSWEQALAKSRKLDNVGLTHLPLHLPVMAGRRRRTDRRAAEADAAWRHCHNGEVWPCAHEIQAQAQQRRGSQGFGEGVIRRELQPEAGALRASKAQNPILYRVNQGWPVG
jgi:hypothetical protein